MNNHNFKVGDIVKITRGVSLTSFAYNGSFVRILDIMNDSTRPSASISIPGPRLNTFTHWEVRLDELELADLSPLEVLLLVDE